MKEVDSFFGNGTLVDRNKIASYSIKKLLTEIKMCSASV